MDGGNLDAHARPPEPLRVLFKRWQKQTFLDSAELFDTASLESDDRVRSHVPSSEQVDTLHTAFRNFTNQKALPISSLQAFELRSLPGEDP